MAEFPLVPEQLLTPEECLEVDRTLLPAADRFAARLAIYALRSLKQIAQASGTAIADLQTEQIVDWVIWEQRFQEPGDRGFEDWYIQLLISASNRLRQIAQDAGISVEELTVPQVVTWFEQDVKARLGT